MLPWSSIGPGGLLLALAALVVWIVILVWLSERIVRFIGMRTAWKPLDWRTICLTFVSLTAAIHLGNFGLDRLEVLISGTENYSALGFPSAFLIGSVAIGAGIAAVRWHRRLTPRK